MSEAYSAEEKYKFTKNPNTFLSEDAYRARFVDVEEAIKDNPEKRGVASAILSACYMAFGPERVDLKKLGPDVLLPRLNSYLVAYNDEIDVAEKIKTSDPEIYEMIMEFVNSYKSKFEEYFRPTGNNEEDQKRDEFKEYFDTAFSEVDGVERELFNIAVPDKPGDGVAESELERVENGRKLVNAIETVMNIRVCLGQDIFSDRGIDAPVPLNISELSNKYQWLIDPDFDEKELSEDEIKARMLFFATMSNQCAIDEVDYKEDCALKVWKKMTYMTEIQKIPPKEAAKVMQKDAERYAELSASHGMSPLPLWVANKTARAISHIKNLSHYSDSARDALGQKAEARGHIREKAINLLKAKNPEKYKF